MKIKNCINGWNALKYSPSTAGIPTENVPSAY